jgi:hypothetical protein
MIKYPILLFAILFSCQLACKTDKAVFISEKFLQSISSEQESYPSQYSNVLFFCKCSANKILYLNIYELREIYKMEYRNNSYYEFLNDALNQRLILNCGEQYNEFQINETVNKNLKKNGINKFIDLYCTKNGTDLYWLIRDIKEDQRSTILYFLFVNNYITRTDDISGAFIIKKIE